MGQAKNKRALREQFFIENPLCCFCGGIVAATTQDHYPPRCLFRERKWPEGYIFLACDSCNAATRDDENLLSLIMRFSGTEPNIVDHAEFRKAINAVRNNYPGVLESLKLNSFDKRKAIKSLGLPRLEGLSLAEVPMVRIPTAAKVAFERFMFKLGCALHYKHVGKVLPPDGQVTQQFRTNVMHHKHPLPKEILEMVPALAKLQRCNLTLDEQFTYRFNASAEIEAGIFVCVFRLSFSAVLLTIGDPNILEDHGNNEFRKMEIKVNRYLRGN